MEQKDSFQEPSQLKQTLLDIHQDFSFDTSNLSITQEIQDPSSSYTSSNDGEVDVDDDVESETSAFSQFFASQSGRKNQFHRCKTAPAMTILSDLTNNIAKPVPDSSSLVRQAAILLVIYLSLGVFIYSFNRDHFSGIETNPIIDALYFCIVTMCTIGYGDIAPSSSAAKIFACLFVLVGFGFIDILLSGVVNYVLDLQENMILTGIEEKSQEGFSVRNYIYDKAKGRMRIRLKVGLAIGVVFLCIGIGTIVLYFMEDLSLIDSFYLSVMSVTTVGYGDRAFKSPQGRLFAAIWLLFSTLAVARAFLYLAEARIDKRHRRIAKWVLHREITVEDLVAADLNHNGFIRLNSSHYAAGELWYFRMLLSRIPGPTCYEDLRRTGNTTYNTYQETCAALGLLNDDNEWHEALQENKSTAFPSQLQSLFVHIILNCQVADVYKLWISHWESMADDILYKQRELSGNPNLKLNEEQLQNYALAEIERMLNTLGKSLIHFPTIPMPSSIYLD